MKIGEFARLGQVSVRMLRHYESLGLLQPHEVDRFSSHRSYSVAQLTRLNRIMALNSLSIPLRKVADFLDSGLSAAELVDMLELRRHRLLAEQSATAASLADVEFRLALNERTTMEHLDCIIKELPAERITDTEAGNEVTCGYRATEAVAEGQKSATRHTDEPHVTALQTAELASCTAATLIHEGSMSRISASWQHLSEWRVTQGYSLIGPCREVYLEVGDATDDSSRSGSDASGCVVELQQPITT